MSISLMMQKKSILGRLALGLACAGLIACSGGSGKRSGLGKGDPPLPPKQNGKKNADKNDPDKPKKKVVRKISKNARKDYGEAVAFYKQQMEAGWDQGKCESAADKFRGVAKSHPKLVEARYMVGRSLHNCGMEQKAEKAYQKALEADSSHALSLSNLGEIYFKAGKADSAKKYWNSAVKADGKIAAARNNLAWLIIKQLRTTKDRKKWKELEAEARIQLSSSLAVDNENVKTYTLYGLLYLEGSERNKNRLDLAKLLLDEGAKRNDKFAPLYNARGLLQMKRNNQSSALTNFENAVNLDPAFVEARMNVGNITLGFRKYNVAETQFAEVLKIRPKYYEALLGLGIAQRGLNKLDEAEGSYKKAMELDKKRGAAYFNMGVLYKDFRANQSHADPLKGPQDMYKEARKYFNQFVKKSDATAADKKEAQDNISDCDKIIKQLDDVMKAMAEAEKAAAADAAANGGGGGDAAGSGDAGGGGQ